MKHYRIFSFILLFICAAFGQSCSISFSGREVLDMNTDWAFYRGDVVEGSRTDLDDSGWIPVALPHIMQLEMKHCGGNSIYDGIGWYRRYFKLPAKYKDKRIVVSFEGVMTNCDVYLNGQKVTEHHGGYMGFVADLTDRIDWNGNNVLAVRVSAEPDPLTPPGKPQDKMDFYYYSGIYRDVRMVITDKVYITDPLEEDLVAGGGQFVTYPEVTKDKARAHLATHVRNLTDKDQTLSVFSQLVDSAGHVIAEAETPVTLHKQSDRTVEQDLIVNQPALWHPYTPNLYTLRTQLLSEDKVLDETTRKIGIRTIRYTAEEGFFINGEKLYMRGANRHQAFANVGDAASNSMQVRDVIDLKRGGYNAVRAAHYPNDPAFLEACDRYGLLVVECIPGWQFYNPDSTFIKRLYEIGRQMIRRDRNHPSVVLWETALNESRYPVSLAKEIFELSHAEYPGDQMYTAGDYFGHAEMEPYYDVFYKQVSKFPKDGDVMSNYPEDFIVVKPLFTREWGDNVDDWNSHNSPSRVNRAWGEIPMLVQAQGYAKTDYKYTCYDVLYRNTRQHMGGCLWHSFDHQRGYHPDPFYGGIMDAFRQPKLSYYMFCAQRPVEKNNRLIAENGPMVFIANAMTPFSPKDVTVYSNCDEVRLTYCKNGKQFIYKKEKTDEGMPSPIITFKDVWDVMYDKQLARKNKHEESYLLAEGIVDGKVVATHKVMPARRPSKIILWADNEGTETIADGSDLITVIAAIADENGNIKRLNNYHIKFEIEGPGELVASKETFTNPREVQWGTAPILVRAKVQTGNIKVKASVVPNGIHTPMSAELIIPTTKAIHPLIADEDELNLQLKTHRNQQNLSSYDRGQSSDEARKQSQMRLKEVEKQQSDFE